MEEDKQEDDMEWSEIQDKFEEVDSSDDDKRPAQPNFNIRGNNESKTKWELEKKKKADFFDGL